jgi:hypothetical protein
MEFDKALRGPISEEFDIEYANSSFISINPTQSYFQNENGTEKLLNEILLNNNLPNSDSAFLISFSGMQNGITYNNFARPGVFGSNTSSRKQIVATYYGVIDLISNVVDQYISSTNKNFTTINGNGLLDVSGFANVTYWSEVNGFFNTSGINDNTWRNMNLNMETYATYRGFRFVRSAE